VIAVPAAAQNGNVRDDSVTARDFAMTPLQDLNLRRDEIPAVLLKAAEGPYANPGLNRCSQIRSEIADLDAVLGDDFDTSAPEERKMTPGKLALGLVSGLMPYRGIIRHLTGASNHEYNFKQAISAGLMRRAYLKGLGEAKDCAYPARPMPAALLAAMAERAAPQRAPNPEPVERTGGEPVFVSQSVVQSLE
jgi:hypothetical protein